LVLAYHHVGAPGPMPPGLTMTPEQFEEQMAFVADSGLVIGLDGLLAELRQGRVPRGGRVLITFDDAALDTYTLAWPVLRRLKLPATLFVPPGLLGKGPFWWNRLYQVTEAARARGRDLGAFLAGAGVPEPDGDWRTNGLWRVLRALPNKRREDIIDAAAQWLGADLASAAGPMTSEQLAEMDKDPFITIGAHTFSHPLLAGLETTRLTFEAAGSREALAGLKSFRRVFAYPYGDPAAVDAAAVRAVHEAGFEAAFTTVEGTVTGAEAPLLLGRLCVDGVGLSDFPYVIDHFLGS
jgi:peptidoglycan/xylan/chitin deacetylase (PgdA/CDA1 family)